tara:strand:+ start:165 stop:692 length:528 start_codon:yes stop_codon:yes gene_type:complete
MDLVGKCLVARPNIIDPFFKRSVVFIYEHSKGGTMGFVINKRKPDIMLRDLLNDRGFDTAQNDPVYNGGPVNPRAVCMVHSTGWQSSNTMIINDQISVTSDDLMIYKFVNGDIPNGYKFCIGSAVWHPKQIVMELQANHWLVTELSLHKIFDYDGRELWDMAIEANAKETIDKFF